MRKIFTPVVLTIAFIITTFTGCLNDVNKNKKQQEKETIVLGFFFGMEKEAFRDTLYKRIQSGLIKDVTRDFDKADNRKMFRFPLKTLSTTLEIEFFYKEDMFFQNKLMDLTCFLTMEGQQDSIKLANDELVDLYMHKYINYQYAYEIDKTFKQPRYTWTTDSVKVVIYSILSAIVDNGDRGKLIPIKEYDSSQYNNYSLYLTVTYSNERLGRLKRDLKKSEQEKSERKEYQKSDSLSKFI
jgi:hypothetical protein